MKQLILPGSRSITNRDLILASLYNGVTTLVGVSVSDDAKFMINALKSLGIEIDDNTDKIIVKGGIERINATCKKIYVGQSGTCMRFLSAFACLLKDGKVTFVGEKRLMERPMEPLVDGIKQLGIHIEAIKNKFPPITINAGKIGNNYVKMNGTVSSQFFTALLNIGAFIKGGLKIEVIGDLVSKPYIDMTILELEKFGIKVINNNYKIFNVLENNTHFDESTIKYLDIEGDASSLSYIGNYIVLHGGEIEIPNLGKNTKQGDYNYLSILQKYFGLVYESNGYKTILKSNGIEKNLPIIFNKFHKNEVFNFENMPDVSMSFMSLAIFLPGDTKIIGLKTLNLKECKRIDAMKNELKKLGVEVKSDEESITIGEYNKQKLGNIKIETYNDHRIAMTFGVLKTYLEKKDNIHIEILNPNCVSKTYPNFWQDLKKLAKN